MPVLAARSRRRGPPGKDDYHAMGALYVPEKARFQGLLHMPEGADIGKALNEAMDAIEADNVELKGVLPRTYGRFQPSTLKDLLKLFGTVTEEAQGDLFGRIYEYFLGNFAARTLQKGGEYFTPYSVVRLIERRAGAVPIVSSSGITGWHDIAKVEPPGIVTGRYGTLGKVFLISTAFWPLNTTLFVKDFKGSDPYWLFHLLGSLNFQSQDSAGAVPGVNRNALHLLPVHIPSSEWQARFGALVAPMHTQIERLQQANERLRAQRDLLLPRLLSGEIDVSRLPAPTV